MFEGVTHKSETRGKEPSQAELIEKTIQELRSYERPDTFIDEGGAGKVYRIPSGFCIKVMPNRRQSENVEKFDLGNSVEQEAGFMERLSMIRIKGVATRTPVYLGYAKNALENDDIIIMEQLKARSLQWILDGRAPLPEHFDLDVFFNDLENYLSHLQDKMHISHGDIAARNIMIDEQTGMPRLIDFGRSHFHLHDSPSEREKAYQKDWDDLNMVFEQMEVMIKKNQS